ncbi:transposase [Massilia sp. W12]|uniref:transposase n=1 Tax=Massilia sp. W12 TaxID=3126507 RepID=UPI0030CB23F9
MTVHLIQRALPNEACFFSDADYKFYIESLTELASRFQCAIHAYALLPNEVHILATPKDADGVSWLMKHLSQRYVQYVNQHHERSGSLWEGRFRSSLLQGAEYVLSCYRYIEQAPVRAGLCNHARLYPWSSYRANAEGKSNALLTPHKLYQKLAGDAGERSLAYRAMCKTPLPETMENILRRACNGAHVLGNAKFIAQIEAEVGYKVTRGRAGRPAAH